MRLKEFVHLEAGRRGLTPHALRMRIWRGRVPMPKVQRINRRVIEVLEGERSGDESP